MRFVSYMAPGYPAAIFKLVAEAIDADLTLITTASGPRVDDDPFAGGHYDVGWMCSISYANLKRQPDPSIDAAGVAWVALDPQGDGQAVYFGDIVVPGDSPITTFDSVRGTRLGCNDDVSLSGLYALKFELDQRGDDPPESFAQLSFTGGHHRSLDLLLAGELDAACVDSIVRLGRAGTDPAVADLRIIKRLGPWPVPPLVVRSDMPAPQRQHIRDAILAASLRPAFQAELVTAGLRELVLVDESHYEPVLHAMASLDQS